MEGNWKFCRPYDPYFLKCIVNNNLKFIRNSTFSDQNITKSFSYYIEKEVKKFNGMLLRKEGRSLIGFCLRAFADVGRSVTRFRVIGICVFSFKVVKILRKESSKGLVFFLKNSLVLLQQSLAGYKIEDQSPLKRRIRVDRSGIPKWIPRSHRSLLRQKDIPTIRLWSSLLGLYRIIDCPSSLNLSSITDGGPALTRLSQSDRRELNDVINRFWDSVGLKTLQERWKDTEFVLFPIGKASPQTRNTTWDGVRYSRIISSTYWSIWASARIWLAKKNDWFLEHLMIFLSPLKSKDWFLSQLWWVGTDEYRKYLSDDVVLKLHSEFKNPDKWYSDEDMGVQALGKLGFKREPAGKVRVFAMVDIWTQWLLYPLHKLIQDVLRLLPEDATFDQVPVLESKLLAMKKRGWRTRKAFSFDLSSATDRLPVLLQTYFLAPLMGLKPAIAWANLLITRKYYISDRNIEDYNLNPQSDKFKAYAVGQPMGALSSWVMLALTHHIIIQWAAYSIREKRLKGWLFRDYVVLGDDVVIFDPFVARRYFYIMTEILGVGIGLAKSIVAKNSWTLEFAKKYYIDGEKANMLPGRDVIVTTLSTAVLSEFLSKHDLLFNHYLKLRGLGFRARSKVTSLLWHMSSRLRTYVVMDQFSKRDWLDWVSMKSLDRNYILSREILYDLLIGLFKEREERIRRALILYEAQIQVDRRFQDHHAYFKDGICSTPGKSLLPETTSLMDDFHFSDDIPWDECDLVELRDMVIELQRDNSHWEEVACNYKTLTWFTQTHTPSKTFRDFLSIYKSWVKYNAIFQKHLKDTPVRQIPTEAKVDLGEGFRERFISDIVLPLDNRVTAEGEPQIPLIFPDWISKEVPCIHERTKTRCSPLQSRVVNFIYLLGEEILELGVSLVFIWQLISLWVWLDFDSNPSWVPEGPTAESEPQGNGEGSNWKGWLALAISCLFLIFITGWFIPPAESSSDPHVIPLILSVTDSSSDQARVMLNQARPIIEWQETVNPWVGASPQMAHGYFEPWVPLE